MYTAECELAGETVMALLYAAKKYEIQTLVKDCSDFLHNNIEDENVCTILQQALILCLEDLVKKCLSYIFVNGPNVLESKRFLSLDREAVQRILESDDLAVDELLIYRACLDWARHQCQEAGEATSDTNLRKTLGDLVYNTRFPNMASKDFTDHVLQTGILTDAENTSIFQSYYLESDTCGKFIKRKRFIKVDPVLARFQEIQAYWVHKYASVIKLTCTRNVNFKGVYIFSTAENRTVSGRLAISDDDRTLHRKDFSLTYEQGKQFEEVLFESPLTLSKEKVYRLRQLCDEGALTYYGVRGHEIVIANGLTITFSESSKNNCGTNDGTSGQFYGLHLIPSDNFMNFSYE